MPHGKASRKRNWQQATKAKAATRKAEKRATKGAMMVSQPRPLTIPTVTEDDLLSFQFAHFGDNTKPDTFFVDPEQALSYRPGLEDLGDDGLGWYEDGVKRTLTDEQIEMFRHSELEQLKRERRLKIENEEREEEDDDDDDEYEPPEAVTADMPIPTPGSRISDGSSLEDELYTNTATAKPDPPKTKSKPKKRRSQSSRSGSVQSKGPLSPRSRQRKTEVPYDQRKKRKWEAYIDATDPVHGSMTHNRMLRELDQQAGDSVAMDYGDDEPAPPRATRPAAMPGRRIISYEDD